MDLEQAYDTRRERPDADAVIEGWRRAALAFRSGLMAAERAELDAIYGHHPRHLYDLFRPRADAGGAVALFLHGGYWQRLSKDVFSHLAGGLLEHGVPVAMAGYRLCPEADLGTIIGDVRQAAVHLHRRLGRPLVVIGHSAGAHLAACLVMTDWKARGFPAEVVTAGIGISGIYDLRPLLATSHNAALGLDQAAAYAASPLLWPVVSGRVFRMFAGGRETEEFIRQSRSLAAVWQACGSDATFATIDGADHFSVVEGLSEPGSRLTRTARSLCLEA